MYWDRRTVITVIIILLPIIAVGAFLIFNDGAKQAMEKNLQHQVNEASKESGLKKD